MPRGKQFDKDQQRNIKLEVQHQVRRGYTLSAASRIVGEAFGVSDVTIKNVVQKKGAYAPK